MGKPVFLKVKIYFLGFDLRRYGTGQFGLLNNNNNNIF
jgi:hypothetical protein